MLGKLVKERYRILEKLGDGGMAVVYKGKDILLNRYVTVKILRPEFTSDSDFVRRFRREAQAVASLCHPNIVSIYDVGCEGNIHYLIMEYVDGENLKSVIKREKILALDKAVDITCQVCAALSHAHENNIVHRDVKPHNILITKSGLVKLTDFGIACEASASKYTKTNVVMGSVQYISPEQAKGRMAGPESDLYAVGVVLYEMVTGRVPFTADSEIGIVIKHIQEEPKLPSRINPSVPASLEKVIMRALRKNPSRRYRSAAEMKEQLKNIVLGREIEERQLFDADESATKVLPALGGESFKESLSLHTGSATAGEDNNFSAQKGDEEYLPAQKNWARYLTWAFLILMAFAAILAGGYYALRSYVDVPEVLVPDVVMKDEEDAKLILEEKGLKVEIERVFHDEIPEGKVISQDVKEIKVKQNRLITLTVSKGPELKTIPNVYQEKLIDAEIMLRNAQLVPGEIQERYDEKVEKGCVIKTEPAANEKLPKGSEVKLYVSLGPEPARYSMPDLRGLTLEAAKEKLESMNLSLAGNVNRAFSYDYLPGQVIDQEPAKNTEVVEGTEVKLTVSAGPGPEEKRVTVVVSVPKDGEEHEVKIMVEDVRGNNEVYVNMHPPGDEFKKNVRYYGHATIRVYIDGELRKEKSF